MLQAWVVIAVALSYIGLLFLVASYGDQTRGLGREGRTRLLIYPLSLAIYCTSWTFFGSVGSASRTGYEFLTIYIGPGLMIGLFSPLLLRIVRLAKTQNITSIADFIAARYGKSQAVAATVALIAIIGTIPYIALQLKAVSSSLETILAHISRTSDVSSPMLGDIALFVALSMAIFAVLFGTRHIDATEHQDGLMLAIATESIVKLFAFLAVGIFVTFWMFGGPSALFEAARQHPVTASLFAHEAPFDTLVVTTLLSFVAIILLPRQFHVAVVENNNEGEIKRAAWLFPLYLVLINLFVLALPLQAGSNILTIAAFVGGLSAATAMVIVESVALSIMVSNDLVMPLVLQRRGALLSGRENVGSLLLKVRRASIFAILPPAYMYYPLAGAAQPFAIGLLRDCPAGAGFFCRTVLAARHRRRRHRRHDRRHSSVGLYAAAANLRRHRRRRPARPHRGPLGIYHAAPATSVRAGAVAAGAWRALEPGAQYPVLRRLLPAPGAFGDRAAAGQYLRAVGPHADRAELPALALIGDRGRAHHHDRALSRRRAHPLRVRELRGDPSHQPGSQGRGRFPAGALCRAHPRLGDRRRLLAAGALAAVAQAHGLDQGGLEAVRRRQRRDPVQPRNPADRARSRAPGHRGVRQGPAADLLEPPVRRNPRSAAEPDPGRQRARRHSALQQPARSCRARAYRGLRAGADRALRLRQRAVPRTLRGRRGDRGARQPHAGRRHRHHLHRHYRQRRGGGSARALQRNAGATRARAHRGAHAAQRRARPCQGRGRRRQYLQDQVPGGGEPRHPATAQRRAALRHQPDRAPGRPRRSLPDRQHRCLARGGGGNLRRAARHVTARHRRPTPGIRQLPHRRADAPDRAGIFAASRRQGARTQIRHLLAGGALRPPAAAPAGAEPGVQRHQIYAGRPRADRLPAPRRQTAHRRLRHRRRHPGVAAARHFRGVPPARAGRPDRARARPGLIDRRAHCTRARLDHRPSFDRRRRFTFRGRRSALECRAGRATGARRLPHRPQPTRGHHRALHRQ